jgi:hypothetical protein
LTGKSGGRSRCQSIGESAGRRQARPGAAETDGTYGRAH